MQAGSPGPDALLLGAGLSIDSQNEEGTSLTNEPLLLSVNLLLRGRALRNFSGDAEAVEHLLRCGADPLIRDKRGWTPLHQAAARGDARMVRTLLQGRGLEVVDEPDASGQSPLRLACLWGEPGAAEAVQVLLLAGADHSFYAALARQPQHNKPCANRRAIHATFLWWECETVEKPYLLHRARCVHEAHTTRQQYPTLALPGYLAGREATAGLPQVEVIGGEGEEDGEQPDTLRFVVEELHPELYTELLQGLRLAD